jgi:hypothetical protein
MNRPAHAVGEIIGRPVPRPNVCCHERASPVCRRLSINRPA